MLDAGRYEATCNGRVPTDVFAYVRDNPGVTGSTLLGHFGPSPHGVSADVLRAAVVGLLRGGKLRIDLPGVAELTSVRDQGARELLKDTGFRKASLFPAAEPPDPRVLVKICQFFKEAFGVDPARSEDAIADTALDRFKIASERLREVHERFRKLPRQIRVLEKLERALESCRRSRNTKATVTALRQSLPVLRDGMQLLRRMESDLSEEVIQVLRDAETVLEFRWPAMKALGATEPEARAAEAINVHLACERPWEDTAELRPNIEVLRAGYRERRRTLLATHATRLEQQTERIKRRDGVEKLNPDQRHSVLRHLQDASTAGGTEEDVAPALESLETYLAARRQTAEQKALAELDTLLEEIGAGVTIELRLDLSGREIRTPAELDRVLGELRERILAELAANRRVRLS